MPAVTRPAAAFLLLALPPAEARAGLFDRVGFGGRAVAMGNAVAAEVDDYAAAFYNPAALTRPRRVHFAGGLLLSMPRLEVTREQPVLPGLETAEPQSFWGWSLALAVPLGATPGRRGGLGLGLLLPSERLLRAATADPGRPQHLLPDHLADSLTLVLAGAWELLPGLSLGAGVQVLADIAARVDVDADLVSGTFTRRETHVELVPSAAPTAGALWEPRPGLRLGASLRGPLAMDYDIPASIDLGPLVAMRLSMAGVALYTPLSVSAGLAWEVGDSGWTVAADATWARWSEAPDPAPRLEIDLGGELLEGVGLEDAVDVGTRARPVPPGFSDTVTPRLGVECRVSEALAVRAGWFFLPTPVPLQTGPTNYVDPHVHVASLGAALTFPDPLRAGRRPLTVEAAAQWAQHLPRRADKADPADPVGDWEARGSVLTVVTALRFDY